MKLNFLGEKKYVDNTVKIAWPCMLENILVSVVTFADTIMVGSLGRQATASVGINMGPTWVLNATPMIFSVGGTVLVARHIGAGERQEAGKVASNALAAAICVSALLMTIMLFLSGQIPRWMDAEADILPLATTYLRIYSLAIIPQFCGMVSAGMIRGAGNTKTPMKVGLFVNVTNIIGNYLLIFETRQVYIPFLPMIKFTMPGAGLGIAGAAAATAFAQTVSGLFLVCLLFSNTQAIKATFSNMRKPDIGILRKILKIGLPAAGERIANSLGQVFYQRMIAGLGTVQVAAHFLATNAESISYMPAGGFSIAATTLIGQSLGAKNKDDARGYAKVSSFLGFCVGVACMILFLLFPEALLRLFSPDPEIIAVGAGAIRVIAVVEPIFTLSIVLTGILRGAGDTRAPFLTCLFSMWCVRLTSTFLILKFFPQLGLTGAWVGMGIDLTVRLILIYNRYRKKKWLDIVI